MRRPLLLVTLFLVSTLCYGQTLPTSLSRYREVCYKFLSLLTDTTSENGCSPNLPDRNALYSVQADFETISSADLAVFVPADEVTRTNSAQPELLFTPEYIDTLIAHNYQLVTLDALSLLRGCDDGDILIRHAAIAPHTTLTWQLEGYDDCALLLVWYPQADLSFSLTDLTTSQTYVSQPDSRGSSAAVTWQMPSSGSAAIGPNILLRLTNNSDVKASFVLAMN